MERSPGPVPEEHHSKILCLSTMTRMVTKNLEIEANRYNELKVESQEDEIVIVYNSWFLIYCIINNVFVPDEMEQNLRFLKLWAMMQ